MTGSRIASYGRAREGPSAAASATAAAAAKSAGMPSLYGGSRYIGETFVSSTNPSRPLDSFTRRNP